MFFLQQSRQRRAGPECPLFSNNCALSRDLQSERARVRRGSRSPIVSGAALAWAAQLIKCSQMSAKLLTKSDNLIEVGHFRYQVSLIAFEFGKKCKLYVKLKCKSWLNLSEISLSSLRQEAKTSSMISEDKSYFAENISLQEMLLASLSTEQSISLHGRAQSESTPS